MRKILYSFLAASALAAGLVSCSSDDPMYIDKNGLVSVTVQIPVNDTRAIGDTLNCNKLTFTIYNAKGDILINDSTVDAFGLNVNSTKLDLQLVPGQTYKMVFYAHNSNSVFSSYSNGEISVNYDNLTPNAEIHDAFCVAQDITVDGDPKTVTLNRAFAQINIGTSDFNNAAVADAIPNLEGSLNITEGLYTNFNILTNTVSTPAGDNATVSIKNKYTVNGNYPVDGYGNLTSVYVLADSKDGGLLKGGSYVITNGTTTVREIPLTDIPVRMNFRTNIYGALLTTQLPITVAIVPAFGDGYNIPLDSKEPEKNVNGTYLVTSPEEINWIAEQVQSGNSFKGVNFQLQNDITYAVPTQPIGYYATASDNAGFSGSFNGNRHTINNLTITQNDGDSSIAALFGYVNNGGEVSYLTVNNATLTSDHTAGGIVGYAHSSAYIHNNNVKNSTIKSVIYYDEASGKYDGGNNCGGIVGYADASCRIDGNSVNGCVIEGYRRVGGIAGGINFNSASGTSFKQNTLYNSVIRQNLVNGYQATQPDQFGLIAGFKGNTNPEEDTNTAASSNVLAYTWPITTGAELSDYIGKATSYCHFELMNDVDCAGVTFNTPRQYSNRGSLEFEGHGYTISNFTDNTNGSAYGGLFPATNGIVIRNLTMKDATVTAGNYSGVLIGDSYSKNTIVENVTFENCTISGGKKIGILEGFMAEQGGTITNITIKNCNVTASDGQAGLVIGYMAGSVELSNCNVTGGSVNVGWEENVFTKYGSGKFVGIIGSINNDKNSDTINFNNCSVSGVALTSSDSELQTLLDNVGDNLWGAVRYTNTPPSIYVNGVLQK